MYSGPGSAAQLAMRLYINDDRLFIVTPCVYNVWVGTWILKNVTKWLTNSIVYIVKIEDYGGICCFFFPSFTCFIYKNMTYGVVIDDFCMNVSSLQAIFSNSTNRPSSIRINE